MKTFSILTASRRVGWEDMARESIDRQTAQPMHWYVVTPYQSSALKAKARYVYEPKKTRASNLCAALNAGLKLIWTDYVIFYQDFIDLPADCFEKLLDLADKNTFVATCTPNYDGSDDGRYTGLTHARPCEPKEWESNVALAPMKAIRELGGFDEEYDQGFAWDNVNLAERAALLGYKFVLDESNRPKLHPHKPIPDVIPNGDFHAQTMEKINSGEKPIKLDYLNETASRTR